MKNKLKNILVPVDLSESALNALNTAIQMAKRHGATLHLLYTQDIMDYYPQMGQLAVIEPMMEDIWEKDLSLLEKTAFSIRHTHNVNCVLHTAAGYRSTIITEFADGMNIDLIVIGTEPEINDRSYLSDSLPYKVLQNAPCHLLTVPAAKEINNFRQIIFPVISREHPINKLGLSQVVAEKNKAAVAIVGMVKKQDLDLLGTMGNIAEQIKGRLKSFAGSVSRSSVYTLNLARDLTALAKKEHAQLLILSGDTRRNLREFFLGSFTQKMIRNADVAVLFIKELPEKTPNKGRVEIVYPERMELNRQALQLS